MHSTFQHCFPSLFLVEEQPRGKECVLFLCKVELVFFRMVYGTHWWNLYPQIQSPPYLEMELVDTLSVSETQDNQYKHTKAFLLNIWLNKSSWPPYRRQPSFQLWNVLEPVKFLFCCLFLFDKAPSFTVPWQMPHQRLHLLLRCKAGYPKTSSYVTGNSS